MSNLYRSEKLEQELRDLTNRTESIFEAVVVSNDGFVVAAHEPEDLTGTTANSPQIAAMTAALVGLGEKTLSQLSQGNLNRLLIEGESGALIVIPINAGASIAALVDHQAKMGLVMYQIRRSARTLN